MFLEFLQLPALSSTPYCSSLPIGLTVSPPPHPSHSLGAEEFSWGSVLTPALPQQLGSPCWREPCSRPEEAPPTQLSRGDPSASQAMSPHIPPSELLLILPSLPRMLLQSTLFTTLRHFHALLWANLCLCLSVSGGHPGNMSWVLTSAECSYVPLGKLCTLQRPHFFKNLLKGDNYSSLSAAGKNKRDVAEYIKVMTVITGGHGNPS